MYFNLRYSYRTLLTSPKCHKKGQRKIKIKTYKFILYTVLSQLHIYNYLKLFLFLNTYRKIFNLFLTSYNCYAVKIIFVFKFYILNYIQIINKIS